MSFYLPEGLTMRSIKLFCAVIAALSSQSASAVCTGINDAFSVINGQLQSNCDMVIFGGYTTFRNDLFLDGSVVPSVGIYPLGQTNDFNTTHEARGILGYEYVRSNGRVETNDLFVFGNASFSETALRNIVSAAVAQQPLGDEQNMLQSQYCIARNLPANCLLKVRPCLAGGGTGLCWNGNVLSLTTQELPIRRNGRLPAKVIRMCGKFAGLSCRVETSVSTLLQAWALGFTKWNYRLVISRP